MNKELFKENQPGVFRILSNALKGGRMGHAYLLWGPPASPRGDAALLLAQSLLCECPGADGFACGECASCRRVEKREDSRLFWRQKPKKKDIEDLQAAFASTADGQRVYVLEDFDLSTVSAGNALLKFLEEPGENITAILTASERSAVLSTVESRCQCLQLRPASVRLRMASLDGVSEDLCRVLVMQGYSDEKVREIAGLEGIENLVPAVRTYMEEWESPLGLFHLQRDLFPAKGPLSNREGVLLFLQVLLQFCRAREDSGFVREILAEQMDVLRKNADGLLVLDQMAGRIMRGFIDNEYSA